MAALDVVKKYYESFNQKDWNGMLALVSPDIRHEPNQGEARIGIEKFSDFVLHMDESYDETLTDLVFFTEPADRRVAVEFVVNGVYKKAEDGLPAATNQTYVVPAAAFLEVADGKITRVTTYYNLPGWIKAVS
ncbi:ketosteroid isomerase-related protein [Larkinella terrae]|uniref:Isopropylmalate/homocitrate/citramalate synthase n=1 Tax=Larkinella terrae TaxID=2025311 RepID=A0A7K0EFW8_9BACT|nr:ketosteroid isomerase-related protein [Larkinella terrae]MRS60592.1 isopropylmalate/homocitrate/citramalate synthase [Larkinella terrae]